MDPLDAFMAAQVLPEVQQAEAAEAAKREAEKRRIAQQLAVRPQAHVCAGRAAQDAAGCTHRPRHWHA